MSTVVDVTIERNRGIRLTFDDGAVCEFPLAELRAACPCATCRSRRDAGRPASDQAPESLAIADAEFVGAWGLSVRWNDGHDTGIYPWDSLRRWHDEGVAVDGSGR